MVFHVEHIAPIHTHIFPARLHKSTHQPETRRFGFTPVVNDRILSEPKDSLPDDTGFFIADDGPGIPDDKQDEIFDYGFTTNTHGTGFGLSIVKEIIDAHEWEIQLAEDTNYGAKFEIYFNPDSQ